MWENFLVSERKKLLEYQRIHTSSCFWRTKFCQEVDYVEEYDGQVYGYGFKWNKHRQVSFPKSFKATYKADRKIVTRENFREFVLK